MPTRTLRESMGSADIQGANLTLSRFKIPKLIIAEGEGDILNLSDAAHPGVQVWRDQHGGVLARCYTHDGHHRIDLPGLASFCFDTNAEEVKAIAHLPVEPEFVLATYCHTVLPMVLQALGNEVLHASAVRTPRGVVALCAHSGVGKSTLAYGFSGRGYSIWADDAVAFETSGPRIRAIPVPFRMRFRPDAASFFNQDRTVAPSSPGVNTPQVETEPARLAALCVLQQVPNVGDRPAVEAGRLVSTQAFTAVLAHAYCFSLQDLERKRRMMRHYLDLSAQVPVFELRFQPGLEKLAAILDTIEQAVNGEEWCARIHPC